MCPLILKNCLYGIINNFFKFVLANIVGSTKAYRTCRRNVLNSRKQTLMVNITDYVDILLAGYPFGGLLYAASGKVLPFVSIAVICLIAVGKFFD